MSANDAHLHDNISRAFHTAISQALVSSKEWRVPGEHSKTVTTVLWVISVVGFIFNTALLLRFLTTKWRRLFHPPSPPILINFCLSNLLMVLGVVLVALTLTFDLGVKTGEAELFFTVGNLVQSWLGQIMVLMCGTPGKEDQNRDEVRHSQIAFSTSHSGPRGSKTISRRSLSPRFQHLHQPLGRRHSRLTQTFKDKPNDMGIPNEASAPDSRVSKQINTGWWLAWSWLMSLLGGTALLMTSGDGRDVCLTLNPFCTSYTLPGQSIDDALIKGNSLSKLPFLLVLVPVYVAGASCVVWYVIITSGNRAMFSKWTKLFKTPEDGIGAFVHKTRRPGSLSTTRIVKWMKDHNKDDDDRIEISFESAEADSNINVNMNDSEQHTLLLETHPHRKKRGHAKLQKNQTTGMNTRRLVLTKRCKEMSDISGRPLRSPRIPFPKRKEAAGKDSSQIAITQAVSVGEVPNTNESTDQILGKIFVDRNNSADCAEMQGNDRASNGRVGCSHTGTNSISGPIVEETTCAADHRASGQSDSWAEGHGSTCGQADAAQSFSFTTCTAIGRPLQNPSPPPVTWCRQQVQQSERSGTPGMGRSRGSLRPSINIVSSSMHHFTVQGRPAWKGLHPPAWLKHRSPEVFSPFPGGAEGTQTQGPQPHPSVFEGRDRWRRRRRGAARSRLSVPSPSRKQSPTAEQRQPPDKDNPAELQASISVYSSPPHQNFGSRLQQYATHLGSTTSNEVEVASGEEITQQHKERASNDELVIDAMTSLNSTYNVSRLPSFKSKDSRQVPDCSFSSGQPWDPQNSALSRHEPGSFRSWHNVKVGNEGGKSLVTHSKGLEDHPPPTSSSVVREHDTSAGGGDMNVFGSKAKHDSGKRILWWCSLSDGLSYKARCCLGLGMHVLLCLPMALTLAPGVFQDCLCETRLKALLGIRLLMFCHAVVCPLWIAFCFPQHVFSL